MQCAAKISIAILCSLLSFNVSGEAPPNRYFSKEHVLPPISFSELADKPDLRVIHDRPAQPYHSPRTLLLKLNAESIISFFYIEQLYPDEPLRSPLYKKTLYFMCRVEADGLQTLWAGPYFADDERVNTVLAKENDFSKAFQSPTRAKDVVAFIRDMRHCHGGTNPAYDDSPYLIDWQSIARGLKKLKHPEQKIENGDASIIIDKKGLYVWSPVLNIDGDMIYQPLAGALSTGLDFESGRVSLLWIDLN